VYFTDRGIEELDDRRGQEQVTIGWLAERLRDFVDDHPESEATIDGLASWLARLDEEDEGLEAGIAAEPGEPGPNGRGSGE
jgi:DNA-binding transcriptional LysR family regulator